MQQQTQPRSRNKKHSPTTNAAPEQAPAVTVAASRAGENDTGSLNVTAKQQTRIDSEHNGQSSDEGIEIAEVAGAIGEAVRTNKTSTDNVLVRVKLTKGRLVGDCCHTDSTTALGLRRSASEQGKQNAR